MNFNALRTFKIVAVELNMTNAAIRLNYSQSTITKHIQNLERSLDTTLLIKTDGKYRLTQRGQELYKHAVNISRELNIIQNIPSTNSVEIELLLQGQDYHCNLYFLPAIKKMYAGFRSVGSKIDCSDNEVTMDNLLQSEIDLGIISGHIIPAELDTKIIG